MARVDPMRKEDVPVLSDLLSKLEQKLGFQSNDLMTMARKPEALKAFVGLMAAVNTPSERLPA